jgi:hypothetical protein
MFMLGFIGLFCSAAFVASFFASTWTQGEIFLTCVAFIGSALCFYGVYSGIRAHRIYRSLGIASVGI